MTATFAERLNALRRGFHLDVYGNEIPIDYDAGTAAARTAEMKFRAKRRKDTAAAEQRFGRKRYIG